MRSYRDRYNDFREQVDANYRPLGNWGKVKAFFGVFSDARKHTIDRTHENALYRPEHIVGTTEAPGQLPTIYYRRPSGTFGHITQEHNHADNVGREPIRNHPDYAQGNEMYRGRMRHVEKIGDRVFHPSRNLLDTNVPPDRRVELSAQAAHFPAVKTRYNALTEDGRRVAHGGTGRYW